MVKNVVWLISATKCVKQRTACTCVHAGLQVPADPSACVMAGVAGRCCPLALWLNTTLHYTKGAVPTLPCL